MCPNSAWFVVMPENGSATTCSCQPLPPDEVPKRTIVRKVPVPRRSAFHVLLSRSPDALHRTSGSRPLGWRAHARVRARVCVSASSGAWLVQIQMQPTQQPMQYAEYPRVTPVRSGPSRLRVRSVPVGRTEQRFAQEARACLANKHPNKQAGLAAQQRPARSRAVRPAVAPSRGSGRQKLPENFSPPTGWNVRLSRGSLIRRLSQLPSQKLPRDPQPSQSARQVSLRRMHAAALRSRMRSLVTPTPSPDLACRCTTREVSRRRETHATCAK